MKPSRERALEQAEQWDGDIGLSALSMDTLGGLCQCLMVSAKGSKNELIIRIRREIRKQYR